MRLRFGLFICVIAAGCAGQPAEPKRQAELTTEKRAGQSDTAGSPFQSAGLAPEIPSGKLTLHLTSTEGKAASAVFELDGLDQAELAELTNAQLSSADWPLIFSVHVMSDGVANWKDRPPVLGSYGIDEGRIQFKPSFPLEPGLNYRAQFDLKPFYDRVLATRNAVDAGQLVVPQAVAHDFCLPKPAVEATTVVTHVFPSKDTLPENQLKFYLHFSAPMSRGEAYRRVHLLDAADKEVDLPFLELDEELWDRKGQRFTLFLDPGRIKRGLKPREEVGPVLEEGNSYTLVIDREWPDAAGNALKESFRKQFRVGAPDDQQPDPNTWKLQPPAAGSVRPLVIYFPEPLDHAMLQRVIVVHDATDHAVAGDIQVDEHETRWALTPAAPWRTGDYTVEVQTDLEDLAGNSIARVFDVDLLEPISRSMKAERWSIPFRIE